ncbi:MAG: putative DNA double-strand break repair Rad50 ATPase [Acidobacteria bacterium OLB17]|nr:MAG: putative DNA double-strand break repair Rad50 ATPase [Acidobacteria bacterium OLB17]MCZ2391307.1 SMC family ATPase [Acidobacteriota bacterium]
MYISRLELENIKSYRHAKFDFAPGITAIRGENGAGKTTIIEAVAWVMFDMLDYTKEQFVRRGEKKGSVLAAFISSLDEREYEVFRDSGSAYFARDPRTGAVIANKKEEVRRFVWLHLGLDQGTDLESLFRQAIGVPQGTFTAVFLSTAAARKAIFDRLLKVDEYRDAAAKLLETSRFVEHRIADIREQVARAEGELARAENVAAERETLLAEAKEAVEKIARLKLDLDAAKREFEATDKEHTRLVELQAAALASENACEKAELTATNARELLSAAEKAAALVDASREGSMKYQEAMAEIKRLEKMRLERDSIQTERNAVDTQLAAAEAEQRSIREQLARAETAAAEAKELLPKAAEQESIEKEIAAIRERIASAKALEAERSAIEGQLAGLREQFKLNAAAIKANSDKAAVAGELIELEKRSGELITSLAGLQASLERDERFQREIKNGLCPILSQKCLNLAPGETLESFVTSQFSTLKQQIGELTSERNAVTERLALAREGREAAAEAALLKRRNDEIKTEGEKLRERSDALSGNLAEAAELPRELESLESRLTVLADARGRLRVLEAQAGERDGLKKRSDSVDKKLAEFQQKQTELTARIEPFSAVDSGLAGALASRDANSQAHLAFLANERVAAELEPRRDAAQKAEASLEAALQNAKDAVAARDMAASSFDAARFENARALVASLDRSHAAESARHGAISERLKALDLEIEKFAGLRESRTLGLAERERLDAVSKTTGFIRDTLKEAAPQIARNYVRHVAVEANGLFREITGNVERTLKWNDDYSVSVEEDTYERPFVSLSGGEQMSAALAVRLALLKQLTEIRIAFFDEPTTNMDEIRRENLASAIRSVTNFDQLFVISHDDTFDNYVDNVIVLGGGSDEI